jgi:hypothetical protein
LGERAVLAIVKCTGCGFSSSDLRGLMGKPFVGRSFG